VITEQPRRFPVKTPASAPRLHRRDCCRGVAPIDARQERDGVFPTLTVTVPVLLSESVMVEKAWVRCRTRKNASHVLPLLVEQAEPLPPF